MPVFSGLAKAGGQDYDFIYGALVRLQYYLRGIKRSFVLYLFC